LAAENLASLCCVCVSNNRARPKTYTATRLFLEGLFSLSIVEKLSAWKQLVGN